MANVVISDLVKRFGSTEVLHGIDLDIADGEFIVFVGPSGCGKSTTLRMIAGLEEISEGEISIGGKVVNHLEPKERNIAMVFQNYAIYPHMSVYRNIGFGLRSSSLDRETKDKRIHDTAELLDLTPLLDRRPSELSGGQRQRVAIGRAMVRDPAVFLFDEPLSNLDAQLRAQMRLELKRLHQRLGTTIIFVTHDQVEAMTLADRIAIMRDGNIEQFGTPDELYSKPANTFVAQFVGSPSMNLLPGSMDAGGLVIPGLDGFDPLPVRGIRAGDVTVGVRPPDLQLRQGDEDGVSIAGHVEIVERLGHEDLIYFTSGPHSLVAQTAGGTGLSPGDEIRLAAHGHTLHLFDPGTGRALTSA